MYCANCGEKLSDDSRFCSACGAEVLEAAARQKELTDNVQEKATSDPVHLKCVQSGRRRSKRYIVIGIAAVIVTATLLVVKASGFLFGGGSSNAYVYLADGKYELITDLSENVMIEMASAKSDDIEEALLAFSPDGKYVYYYTKYDRMKGTGTLCRAEYGKLKENSADNSKYIKIIDADIKLGFQFAKDGNVVYKNGDDTLYYFDGKTVYQLAKDVKRYYTDGSDRVAYVTIENDNSVVLYGTYLSDMATRIKLASDYSWIYSISDLDHIAYMASNSDNTLSLYSVGFDRDAEKIADDAEVLYTFEDGRFYYTAKSTVPINLYDYIGDSNEGERTPEALQQLQDMLNENLKVTSLYCYEEGKSILISDNSIWNRMITYNQFGEVGLIFVTADDLIQGIDWNEIPNDKNDLEEIIMSNLFSGKLYMVSASGSTPIRPSEDSAEFFARMQDGSMAVIAVTDSDIYMLREDGALYAAPVKNGVAGAFAIVTDEAAPIRVQDSVLYYASNYDQNNGLVYGDIYARSDGQETRLMQDILLHTVQIYSDNVVCAYSGYENGYGYELVMAAADGTQSFIDDDVTQFIRTDEETLLYISDGDLYRYDGAGRTRIAEDTDRVWAMHSMEITTSIKFSMY